MTFSAPTCARVPAKSGTALSLASAEVTIGRPACAREGDGARVREAVDLFAHIRRCTSSAPSVMGRAGFTEPRIGIDGISQRMLTVTLRGLERDAILTRTVGQIMPPQVSDDLTDTGRSLLHATQPLLVWSIENLSAMDHARPNSTTAHHHDRGHRGRADSSAGPA